MSGALTGAPSTAQRDLNERDQGSGIEDRRKSSLVTGNAFPNPRSPIPDPPMLTPETLPDVQHALADAGVDGWLLYDFRGLNPIASDLMRLEGMTTRRAFAFVPTRGTPVAVTHVIEQAPWRRWPADWPKEIYASWQSLESLLAKHVAGKRVAMEYSAGDAVPYLDTTRCAIAVGH